MHTTKQKTKRGIGLIYGMMTLITVAILLSVLIDAKSEPAEKPVVNDIIAEKNPSNAPTSPPGQVTEDSDGAGMPGSGGAAKVMPAEKRNEAPQNIVDRANAYLKALLTEGYVKKRITFEESYKEREVMFGPNPPMQEKPETLVKETKSPSKESQQDTDAGSYQSGQGISDKPKQVTITKNEDISGADANNQGREVHVVTYRYSVPFSNEYLDGMALGIRVVVDKDGNIIAYDGPEYPYQFKLSVDDVKKIARDAGMQQVSEMKIIPGWWGFMADNNKLLGEGRESIMWQTVSSSAEVGAPEGIYIDVDTGKILGSWTKQKYDPRLALDDLEVPRAKERQTGKPEAPNEMMKKVAELRAKVPKVTEQQMEKFEATENTKSRNPVATWFSKIARFFKNIF